MLRLITYARQQQTTQDMSFIRRLVDYTRFIIRNHQILFGKIRSGGEVEYQGLFRVEGGAGGRGSGSIVGGGRTIHATGPRGSGSSWNVFQLGSTAGIGGGSGAPSAWQRIGQQVRQLFINNVLRRATTNTEVARRAAQRLLYGDSRPFFALVGVSLATGSVGVVSQGNEFDSICWEIRESIAREHKKAESETSEEVPVTSVSDLNFGPLINQGCNAAVYAANHTDSTDSEWSLAVKMMFNYDLESNAFAILKGMVREIVPARQVDLKSLYDLDKGLFASVKRCPPHPNVIDIQHAFVDNVPLLSEGLQSYPSALPRRLNPDDGLGRNMSLFLVMKRYDANLDSYLRTHQDLTYRTRLLILTQILSGVAHLEQNKIAHRDLKTDNILVSVTEGYNAPEVVISDFGCCLADKNYGLSLPFKTYDTDRGGNAALTAPEISTAVPGTWKYLNYSKSDAWSAGAIAYEILGERNPFYERKTSSPDTTVRLDSRTYSDADLPEVNCENVTLRKLVHELLRRNPNQRVSAEMAFCVCIVLLWAPSDWMGRGGRRCPNDDEILQWLVCLTTKALCNNSNNQLEFKIMRTFLRKVKFSLLKASVAWMIECHDEE